jgi:hypothetical protein
VNSVVSQINQAYERAEKEILQQVDRNQSLVPGSRQYDIALDELFRKKLGEPSKT